MKRNLSREAHTWYTLISPEHMDRAFAHISKAYAAFDGAAKSHALAGDYAPTGYWGGQMEELLQTYDHARAMLVAGDFSAMIAWGGTLEDIPRGLKEGVTDWLGGNYSLFWNSLNAAYSACSRFWSAVEGSQMFTRASFRDGTEDWRQIMNDDWSISGASIYFYEEAAFPTRPVDIPEYAPDTSITCRTGEIVPWTGLWVPSYGLRTSALAFARKDIQLMQFAYEVVYENPDDGSEEFDCVEATWHPVRPTGRMIPWPEGCGPLELDESIPPEQRRCAAGYFCPKAGYWMTPAKTDSRRMFREGDVMPELGSAWGMTIWQWDADQVAP